MTTRKAVNRDTKGHYTTPECQHDAPDASGPDDYAPTVYIVTADKIKIRTDASPSTDYERPDTAPATGLYLAKGSTVTVIEEKNGWGRLADGRGWFLLSLAKKAK